MHVTPLGIRLVDGAWAHRQAVADLDVRELVDAGAERPVERAGWPTPVP
jgi:hypothetical protein